MSTLCLGSGRPLGIVVLLANRWLSPCLMSVVRRHPAGTVQAALTESEIASIVEPRPFPSIELGGESIPYMHSHPSMLYWRLGLCDNDKFECLALGTRLNKNINGLRTAPEYVHRCHSAAHHAQHVFVALAACRSFLAVCVRWVQKATNKTTPKIGDPHVLARISTRGSGETEFCWSCFAYALGCFLLPMVATATSHMLLKVACC